MSRVTLEEKFRNPTLGKGARAGLRVLFRSMCSPHGEWSDRTLSCHVPGRRPAKIWGSFWGYKYSGEASLPFNEP